MSNSIILMAAYLVFAPIAGGILAGIEGKINAKLQGKEVTSVMQPFLNVFKFMEEYGDGANKAQEFYSKSSFVFVLIAGSLFFAGQNLLLIIFTLIISSVLRAVGAYCSNSPYAQTSAEQELLKIMEYKPMMLITAIGFYLLKGSFNVAEIVTSGQQAFVPLIGIFMGSVYILAKSGKSSFEISNKSLAFIEISRWYENILFKGFVFIFFANGTLTGVVIGLAACVAAYSFEIFVNACYGDESRQFTLCTSWTLTIALGVVNIVILYIPNVIMVIN